MIKKIKKFVENHSLLRRIAVKLKYQPVKINRLSKEINHFFENLPSSLELFKQKKKIETLIISLTSFPVRLNFIEHTLFSLIKQTIRPERIILWLSEEEFPNKENDIPENIKRYFLFDLEIKFVKENYKSYKKLTYAIQQYPENIIVTADDDVYYKSEWLSLLYNTYILFPLDIIAYKARKISFKKRKIVPYLKWKTNASGASHLNFGIGYGGILYPPHSLHKDICDSSLFLKLCPSTDDIWFYVMELLAKRKVRKASAFFSRICSFDYQFTEEYKKVPQLIYINWDNNSNNLQLEAALQHYNIFHNFFEIATNG